MQEIIFLIIFGFLGGIFFLILFFLNKKIYLSKEEFRAIKDLEKLTDLILIQLRQIQGSLNGSSETMRRQIYDFTKETTQLREDLKKIQQTVEEISSFQEFFKAPKLRGEWGEASLKHLLSEYFPKEFYKIQHFFSTGAEVDAVLRLPNGKLLPIDAKFPFDNFRKMIQAQSKEEKENFRKKFFEDVKIRIQEISKKYILPSENTVDFALMYVPAEAVYYEINMAKEIDLISYAQAKKVIITSPNTIYLTLRTIEHWFKDTKISQQTQQILQRLSKIQQDALKLKENFRKLGSHLKNALSAYDDSERRLSLFSERVEKLTNLKEIKKLK